MARQSQFLGVQFAAVVLRRLLVRVERHAAHAAVDTRTCTPYRRDVTADVIVILPVCSSLVVFVRRTLHAS